MRRTNAAVKAGRAGDRLRKGLDEIILRLGLPYVTYNHGLDRPPANIGRHAHEHAQPDQSDERGQLRKHMMEEMGAAFSAHGIITIAGSRIYTGLADTDEVIDDALNRFEDVLKLV